MRSSSGEGRAKHRLAALSALTAKCDIIGGSLFQSILACASVGTGNLPGDDLLRRSLKTLKKVSLFLPGRSVPGCATRELFLFNFRVFERKRLSNMLKTRDLFVPARCWDSLGQIARPFSAKYLKTRGLVGIIDLCPASLRKHLFGQILIFLPFAGSFWHRCPVW